jgi:hypothetical protein
VAILTFTRLPAKGGFSMQFRRMVGRPVEAVRQRRGFVEKVGVHRRLPYKWAQSTGSDRGAQGVVALENSRESRPREEVHELRRLPAEKDFGVAQDHRVMRTSSGIYRSTLTTGCSIKPRASSKRVFASKACSAPGVGVGLMKLEKTG